ncbi:MAG: hypothetical protein GXO43_09570 [Crenarchaeota archaeon]|nr:hypothetical protein [Thermoproteota archaeon]
MDTIKTRARVKKLFITFNENLETIISLICCPPVKTPSPTTGFFATKPLTKRKGV